MPLADIDTIIVLIMENRSFDHMLGYLAQPKDPAQSQVDGINTEAEWLQAHANLLNGTPYQSHRLGPDVQFIDDPKHSHLPVNVQITMPPADPNLGSMGGFVQSYLQFLTPPPPAPELAMGYYDAEALPIFDFLAGHFAICDHWFAAIPTCTQPSRLMAMSGECSIVDNVLVLLDERLVYDWLAQNRVPWCVYQKGTCFPFFTLMPGRFAEIVTSITGSLLGGRGSFRRFSTFADDWRTQTTMPSVIFIEPAYSEGPLADPCDDHAPTGVAKGQAFMADVYQALIGNPERWARTMMIVTYDEHGGFFDHVPPLPIPTAITPDFQFQTTGVRVPAFVISPQVEPGSVFAGNLDHTSILQLLAEKFTPGHGYSVAVNARQGQLDRLSSILTVAPSVAASSLAIPPAILAGIAAQATNVPPTPPHGAAPTDPTNSRALHNVALRLRDEHPELLNHPAWRDVGTYLAAMAPTTSPAAQR